jgi:hypothetical protein
LKSSEDQEDEMSEVRQVGKKDGVEGDWFNVQYQGAI